MDQIFLSRRVISHPKICGETIPEVDAWGERNEFTTLTFAGNVTSQTVHSKHVLGHDAAQNSRLQVIQTPPPQGRQHTAPESK